MPEEHNLVVIGASAGGLQPLKLLLSALPRSTNATVLIVVHRGRSGESHLADVLTAASALPAAFPDDKAPVRAGAVYIAPANKHMAIEGACVRVLAGPQENGQRPAIDMLFRTAAQTYGRRVIGIVLSGALDDGAAGLRAIKEAGGVTMVQSPDEADYSAMPESAIRDGAADYVLPLPAMARTLLRLIRGSGRGTGRPRATGEFAERPAPATSGPTPFTEQWTGLRLVRERVAVLRRMARRAREQGQVPLAARYETDAAETERTADVMRQLLFPE